MKFPQIRFYCYTTSFKIMLRYISFASFKIMTIFFFFIFFFINSSTFILRLFNIFCCSSIFFLIFSKEFFLFSSFDKGLFNLFCNKFLINSFANCGLSAQQTSNEDLRVILDNFLNGGKKAEFGTVVSPSE